MLPRVILQNGISADGRMDWYSGDVGLYYELAGRFQADAMLSGSQTIVTALAGQELTETEEAPSGPPERDPADTRPWLVIVDSRGRVGPLSQIRRQPYWRDVIILCSRATPQARLRELEQQQVEHIIAGDDRVDLAAALAEVRARYNINVVRVDSGGVLNGALLRAGLVNELSLIVNPYLVGGTTPSSFFTAPDLSSADGIIPLRLTHFEQLQGDVIWLRYEVISRPGEWVTSLYS